MKTRDVLAVFNRGRISRLALARTDVARVALSADVQTNWMPRTLGSMMFRPGMKYIEDSAPGVYLKFVYSINDKAIIDVRPTDISILTDGTTPLEREAVTATVTNGTFTTDLTGWTDNDDVGATSDWTGGDDALGVLRLLGTGSASARRHQTVTVPVGDQAKPHALKIVTERGPVILRIGSTAGSDNIFRQSVLRTGTHNIAFVPNGNFTVEFSSYLEYPVWVQSCQIQSGVAMTLPSPWATLEDCKSVRSHQIGDVVFCYSEGYPPYRIERRPNNSWSIVKYLPDDGPWMTENVENVTLQPNALRGRTQLNSSRPVFKEGHVGGLFKVSSQGQRVEASLSAPVTYTDEIRVVGVTDSRKFEITKEGTWNGTLSLQRSVGTPGSWVTVVEYTTNGNITYDDGLDNSIAYYRIGFETGNHVSGTADVTLDFASGSITGVARVVDFVSETEVGVVTLSPFGGTGESDIWAEGAWSDAGVFPEAGTIWEGRNWSSGEGRNWASVSDAFASYSLEVEGDSGAINRQISETSAYRTNWMLGLQRLIVGTDSGEYSIKSTSFDEPVTPTNYNVKVVSTKGSARIPAVSVDGRGYFIGRDNKSVYEMVFDPSSYGYQTIKATTLCPEIGVAGFVRMDTQQSPDTRIIAVRADGTVAVLIRDPAEDVNAWVDIETDGEVLDVCVLPDVNEDRVFFRVKRFTAGGAPFYTHEEMAREDQCRGGEKCFLMDSCVESAASRVTASTTIPGLTHLEGREVVVWGDGAYQGRYTVSGGTVTTETAVLRYVAGLPYEAKYKSAKLAGQTSLGLALTQRSRIDHIGLLLADTHASGLQYGPSFDVLDDLPMVEDGAEVDADAIWTDYEGDMFEFPGEWSTDNRICLKAQSPFPCTVLAAVLSIDRQDKA